MGAWVACWEGTECSFDRGKSEAAEASGRDVNEAVRPGVGRALWGRRACVELGALWAVVWGADVTWVASADRRKGEGLRAITAEVSTLMVGRGSGQRAVSLSYEQIENNLLKSIL